MPRLAHLADEAQCVVVVRFNREPYVYGPMGSMLEALAWIESKVGKTNPHAVYDPRVAYDAVRLGEP